MIEDTHHKIKRMARDLGCPIKDLLVLAPQNDPFYAGRSKTEREKAEWFAEVWQRLGYADQTGIHLRRLHYALISQEEQILKHNGEPYHNTKRDWNYLNETSKYARYLSLVDPKAFVDRRNPDPHNFIDRYIDPLFDPNEEPDWGLSEWWDNVDGWRMPSISSLSGYGLDWDLPEFEIRDFDYNECLQPYHIEIWCEKSTMNDIIIPICRRYGVNLVTGLGFMSITAVIQLLNRIKKIGKPTRIFYISDFDSEGNKMPPAVSRQIEYWLSFYDLDFDIKLTPIVLTKEQVKEYNPPQTPTKNNNKNKKNFELSYGEGAVELDALESLHPGELSRILTEKILEFRDEELREKIDDAKGDFNDMLLEIWKATVEPYQDELDGIKEEIKPILEKYNNKLVDLDKDLQDELKPMKDKLENAWHGVNSEIENIKVNTPDKPQAEAYPDEEWLFDSERDYVEQIECYRRWNDI